MLAQFFVFHASADQRLALLNGSQPHNPVVDAPSNPMQALFANPSIERRLSEICDEAFGAPLHLSRLMAAELNLYVGAPSAAPSVVPTREYVAELQKLPLLSVQGDGMRSFMGLMLALTAGQYQLLLIDAPEAFLHPPQARQLGRRIASEAPNTQVVVATHDVNILRGLLEADTHDVSVVRLTREENVNSPTLLSSERVAELWRDPVLHYSNAFEGLFHRGVVICEADTDARFYASVGGSILVRARSTIDGLLFTHAGGKDRLQVLAAALRAVDVPVAVIADIDLLRDDADVERLLAALGSSLADQNRRDLAVVRSAVEALGSAPPRLAVQSEINEILDGAESTGRLTRDDVTSIRATLRLNDGRQIAKRGGLASLPGGDAYSAAARLIDRLCEAGLFVVPAGELERWFPEVGRHGTAWVSEVLARGLHARDGSEARSFMTRVACYFSA